MRLAGTCNRYSNRAMSQLMIAATYHGLSRKLRRWAYHANVMNTFEQVSRATVTSVTSIGRLLHGAAADGAGQRRVGDRDEQLAIGHRDGERHAALEPPGQAGNQRAVEGEQLEAVTAVNARPRQAAQVLRRILVHVDGDARRQLGGAVQPRRVGAADLCPRGDVA